MTDFWKRKLLAYLHDPPSKPFQVADHREVAETLVRNAFPEMAPADAAWFFEKVCDHTAAAADRVICPRARAMKADWQAEAASFKHPLGGGMLHFGQTITATWAEELVTKAQPHALPFDRLPPDKQDWARFFCHWRLWPQQAAELDPRLAHLPADTRLPDHTIWTHCSLVSALQSCVDFERQGDRCERREFKPAFLLVQIGPVQDFISQARTTRDLWSGSYLLSWLIAHGIKAITDSVGPDCVLFPSLRGQPLFDFLHKKELYGERALNIWDDLGCSPEHILTPTLPNRFLAIVPEHDAGKLASAAQKAMEHELCESISTACLNWLKEQRHEIEQNALDRWHQQLRQFLTIHWQSWTWESDIQKAIDRFKELPAGCFTGDRESAARPAPAPALELARDAATRGIPFADLDPRNYKHRSWKEGEVWKSVCIEANGNDLRPGGAPLIENPGFAWAAHYAEAEFRLAARRNSRDFEPWGLWKDGQCLDFDKRDGSVKDMLSGKEEVISSSAWQKGLAAIPGHHFRENERLGAVNLIKRIWHVAYLKTKDLEHLPRFDSVPAVAAGNWRERLIHNMGKTESIWTAFLSFSSEAVGARQWAPFEIPKSAPDQESRTDERRWLAKADASIFHVVEWDRAIRDEPGADASFKLKAARDALLRLQNRSGLDSEPSRYVAVLAMDGDSMGEWVSGAKSPVLKTQLSDEARDYFQRHEILRGLMSVPRHVSPSYHLQLSQALANFSLYLAGSVVEHFDGQVIYSGGDDVLAMLPAERVLECAAALRMAFRGDPALRSAFPGVLPAKDDAWGFVGIDGGWDGWSPWQKRSWPRGYQLILPGKSADISAGIAIGHMHSPLQNLVEAARAAERRAKRKESQGGYSKSAFAVSLFKRSGETIEWGAKWDSSAVQLGEAFARHRRGENLTGRFPYALAALLSPYAMPAFDREHGDLKPYRIERHNGFDPFAVFSRELEHVLNQQSKAEWRRTEERSDFEQLARSYLTQHCQGRTLDDFLGPFLTTTFIQRGGE